MKIEEVSQRMGEIRGYLHNGIAKLIELEKDLEVEFTVMQRTRQNIRHNEEVNASKNR